MTSSKHQAELPPALQICIQGSVSNVEYINTWYSSNIGGSICSAETDYLFGVRRVSQMTIWQKETP